MASGTFATLIKLIPLDSADNRVNSEQLPEHLAEKKAGKAYSGHLLTIQFCSFTLGD